MQQKKEEGRGLGTNQQVLEKVRVIIKRLVSNIALKVMENHEISQKVFSGSGMSRKFQKILRVQVIGENMGDNLG